MTKNFRSLGITPYEEGLILLVPEQSCIASVQFASLDIPQCLFLWTFASLPFELHAVTLADNACLRMDCSCKKLKNLLGKQGQHSPVTCLGLFHFYCYNLHCALKPLLAVARRDGERAYRFLTLQ